MLASKNTKLLNKIISAKAELNKIDDLNALYLWHDKVVKLLTDSGVDMEETINELKMKNPNRHAELEISKGLSDLVLNSRRESTITGLDKIIIHLTKRIEEDKSKPNFLYRIKVDWLIAFVTILLPSIFFFGRWWESYFNDVKKYENKIEQLNKTVDNLRMFAIPPTLNQNTQRDANDKTNPVGNSK